MTIAVEIEMPGCTLMTGNAAEAMEVLLGAEVRRAPPLIFVCLSVLLLHPITGSFANTHTWPKYADYLQYVMSYFCLPSSCGRRSNFIGYPMGLC